MRLDRILLIGGLLIGTVACNDISKQYQKNKQEASAEVSQDFEFKDFDIVEVGSIDRVIFKQGNSFKIVAEGPQTAVEQLVMKQNNNKLTIKRKNDITFNNNTPTAKITITIPELHKLVISGATEVQNTGVIAHEGNLDIVVSGAGSVNFKVAVEKLNVTSTGASSITLAGKANHLGVDVSGIGQLNAFDLNANDVFIDASGTSNIKLVAHKTLQVNASGTASIVYRGKPTVQQKVSGIASLTRRD